jgi:hypothetical protein
MRVEDVEQQRVLGRIVVIYQSLGDTTCIRKLNHRGPVIALFGENTAAVFKIASRFAS